MSLYKPGQIRACFCLMTEKSQIIQLKISFHYDNFRVDFFQRRKFSVKFEHISWNYRN